MPPIHLWKVAIQSVISECATRLSAPAPAVFDMISNVVLSTGPSKMWYLSSTFENIAPSLATVEVPAISHVFVQS